MWIDSDAACGYTPHTDVDDCLALWLLAARLGAHVAGVSTVFGNAPLDVTDRATRELVHLLRWQQRHDPIVVYRGSHDPSPAVTSHGTPARDALIRALEAGPLTIIALGPLTNIAHALESRPDLRTNVARVVAVMGRRMGHLFHPSEASGRGTLLGHGPVFRDFNFSADPHAARGSAGYRSVTLSTFRDVPWNRPFYEKRKFYVVHPRDLSPQHVELVADERARGLPTDLRVIMEYRTSLTPIAIALSWIAAANVRDIEGLIRLSDPAIEIVGPRGSVRGTAILRDWLSRAGLTLESRRTFARNGNVVIEQHGVWRSPETGEVVGAADVASRFKVEGARVVAYGRFDNLAAALSAAGLSGSDETVEKT